MEFSNSYSFTRYLSAKKTVDDRALNKTVLQSLMDSISGLPDKEPLRILEIGAGIGTMVERALDWGMVRRAEYRAIDAEPENISEAIARLPIWAKERGFCVEAEKPERILLKKDHLDVSVHLERADVFEFMARGADQGKWDLLIANAFLDLVDVPATLPDLFALLKPGGLFYFTVTFDGGTILQPELDTALDAQVEALYHETMDRRIIRGKPSGDSRTGRHFFHCARSAGANILAAGSSDWVVFAGRDGYPADEAYFLHFIIDTMAGALKTHPDLDRKSFAHWVEQRHLQIDEGTLVYIAHQMDFLGTTHAERE
jgi:SAM-dependent methyltransferase